MKRIYSMGRGKYITMDSYGETHENRRWSIAIALFSTIIATITASSLLGVDMTQLNPQPIQEKVNEAR
jgi:hypothetical protein